ncbi:type II secretion system protein L [Vibrio nigripulchritudo]|uniref:type II secretion system protein GspL n=1 Tax=Vibrio nigripulchritudo TaxID=28173 RepID=UPI00190B0808|nr:type II secretion system protein GspL [Vibrio nigripulchritudo]BCL68206.1 type II secretion system protein L [Vibrio nigripulchritudo]BDU29534.1 type II secretion system protein L [Vibrio nigripulchritudo]
MSEFLTVRISSQADAPIQWLVWSPGQQEVIASGELSHRNQLGEIASYAHQRPTIVLLASSDVLLKEVDIPAGGARQLNTMLPFLVEDDVAQDVDDLHFTVLNKRGAKADVAAVDSGFLETLLDELKAHQINVRQVLPDCLAMPWQKDEISALEIDGQWVFRQEQYSGFSVQSDWLSLLPAEVFQLHVEESESESEEQSDAVEKRVATFTPLPQNHESLPGRWQNGKAELVMSLLTQGAIASKANLLTGTFKPSSSLTKYWKVWQKAAVAAVLLLVVLTTQNVLQVNAFEAQAAQYRAESERIFREVFPDKRKIPTVSYLKRQMRNEEARLSGGGSDESMLIWLSKLPEALKKNGAIDVLSVKYDGSRDEIRIQAKSKDFQTFESARAELAQLFDVEQGQLNRSGTEVFGSYVIRRKP